MILSDEWWEVSGVFVVEGELVICDWYCGEYYMFMNGDVW